MIKGINTEIDYSIKCISYLGISSYGKMYIGNMGIEFFNDKNIKDFILIPWTEVEYISASVIFGRYINRFSVFTKKNGHFEFSTRDNKKTLKAMNKYISSEKLLRSPSFLGYVSKFLKKIF
ncbi:DUF956 family protein [Oceanivirga miroungae]|uniref:DUF956 family protein n=1 Tax=Oceanivirga miroungae TaxID=1130046 RepID=A0A6I8M9C1_9FUSO|nr:DUF956 family protein [Oceanivirga miroungae]VWL85405.1 hypothetical protein OMES3154_00690 [Oceanivirga miroungae]